MAIKQAKKEYNKYKEKFPNRPPNEIDFGLGFKAALEWVKGRSQVAKSLYMIDVNDLDEELQ